MLACVRGSQAHKRRELRGVLYKSLLKGPSPQQLSSYTIRYPKTRGMGQQSSRKSGDRPEREPFCSPRRRLPSRPFEP